MRAGDVASRLFRKKTFDGESALLDSQMKRCLSVMDVMFLAVGQMIGAGIYVLAGTNIFKLRFLFIFIFMCSIYSFLF